MGEENRYIQKRIWKARFQSVLFYICRIFPIRKKKIVFCCIEGTTGYSCNPKYIAGELILRNEGYELVWLVNDINKTFPKEIKAVKNTLLNRAYHLTTARFWIDNSRKQLECRKRKGQTYIQTWHAKLGFKPTCLDRGASFSKIAYLVSKHDSDMIDYWLSNSDWYDKTLPTGSLYKGKTLRSGSPRCDILVNNIPKSRAKVRQKYNISPNSKILMYAPTFRGGSQGTDRTIAASQGFPDYKRLKQSLENRFGGEWYIFLRLHPQLVARNLDIAIENSAILDVSREDDMYEILAGCDAFMTDYSSAAFDAAVMRIPIFLYADDYAEYEGERGKLLWNLRKLPFPLALTNDELEKQILDFNETIYQKKIEHLFQDTGMVEDGQASKRVVDEIEKIK
jgi:CDP-glycerol glycerophosphotransferase